MICQVHPQQGWTLKLCVATEPEWACLARSPLCSERLRTWPPSNALIARSTLTFLPGQRYLHACHHGGTQRPGYYVSKQVLSQFLVLIQLRERQEGYHQRKQFVRGLSKEERRIPQRSVWDQFVAGRARHDAGQCSPHPRY